MIFIYQILSCLLSPVIILFFIYRLIKNKEDKSRFLERFAISKSKFSSVKENNSSISKKKTIWIHAVSVGELNSILTLILHLLEKNKDSNILVTTNTIESANNFNKFHNSIPSRLQNNIIHQFLPVDIYFIICFFIKKWHISKIILTESEIWPNIITIAHKKHIPLFLLNGKLSRASFTKWLFIKNILAINLFTYFNKIFTQNNKDYSLFANFISYDRIFDFGNLKDKISGDRLLNKDIIYNFHIKDRKLFIAASTHKGEEEIIIDIYLKLFTKHPDLLLILAPRHPKRSQKVQDIIANHKLKFVLRSNINSSKEISKDINILLIDTIGELTSFYRISDIILIAGSFFKSIGGHNPYEILSSDSVFISYKYVENFYQIYNELSKKELGFKCNSTIEIINKIDQLLSDRDYLAKIIYNIKQYKKHNINNNNQLINKICQHICYENI